MRRTAGNMIRNAIIEMERHNIPEAEVSARLIMSHTVGQRQFVDDNHVMTSEQIVRFRDLIENRVENRTPVQYLLGEWDFHNLTGLKMKSPVLIPRPETEQLVEFAIEVADSSNRRRVLDPCAGSGAIGLALLRHFPDATCLACDINKDAVDLARHNASLMGLSSRYKCVESCVSKLVEKNDKFDLLVCNPPYIFTSDMSSLAPEVFDHEDHVALDGGEDGYDVVRLVLSSAKKMLQPGAQILLELDSKHPEHFESWLEEEEFKTAGFSNNSKLKFVEWRRDFSSLPRFVRLEYL